MTRRIPAPRRAAFTVIELLVVIAIIAILVALTTAAVQKVRDAAKRTAAAAEISQVATSVASFKEKTGASYIPCTGSSSTGMFQLRAHYFDPNTPPGSLPPNAVSALSSEAVYLKSLFPYLPQDTLVPNSRGFSTGITLEADLDANQVLAFFLTGGTVTNFQGFSTNKQAPFSTAGGQRIGPFIDLPANKFVSSPNGHVWLIDPWGSPYAYFTFDPTANRYPATSFTIPGHSGWPYTAFPYSQNSRALNQKGFQVISAGKDGKFGAFQNPPPPTPPTPGTAGVWTPGLGDWSGAGVGADDMSNFNTGPLTAQN